VGIPFNAREILLVDAIDFSVELFGNEAWHDQCKWCGGVAAADGRVVGIPYYSAHVLIVDAVARSAELFGHLLGPVKWSGGAAAGDGQIFAVPFCSRHLLAIDPEARSAELIGDFGEAVYKWYGAVSLPDGGVLGIPCHASQALRVARRVSVVLTLRAERHADGFSISGLNMAGEVSASLVLESGSTVIGELRAQLAAQLQVYAMNLSFVLPNGELLGSGCDGQAVEELLDEVPEASLRANGQEPEGLTAELEKVSVRDGRAPTESAETPEEMSSGRPTPPQS